MVPCSGLAHNLGERPHELSPINISALQMGKLSLRKVRF